MVFAEFYQWSTGWNGQDFSGPKKPIPMCGSDSIFSCDGRKTLRNQINDAVKRARSIQHLHGNGIIGLIMRRGERLNQSKAITKYISLLPQLNGY